MEAGPSRVVVSLECGFGLGASLLGWSIRMWYWESRWVRDECRGAFRIYLE